MNLDDYWPPVEPREAPEIPRRHRHVWFRFQAASETGPGEEWTECELCHVIRDEAKARRGRQSRNYGNRAELAVARKYGGEKIGAAGGPVDVRGKDFNTQVKTHRRQPPREWVGVFNAMSANRERCARLLLRFVMGPGVPPRDYFVFQADDFLEWFGPDVQENPGGTE